MAMIPNQIDWNSWPKGADGQPRMAAINKVPTGASQQPSQAPKQTPSQTGDSQVSLAIYFEGLGPVKGGASRPPSQAPKQTPSQTGGQYTSARPGEEDFYRGGNITTQAMIPSEMGSPPQPTQDTGGTVTTTAFPENWDVRQVGPAPGQPVSQPQPPQKPPRQTTPPGQLEKMPPAQRRPQQPPHQRPQHPQQGAIPVPQGQYPVQSPAYGNWQVNNQQMNQWMQQMQQRPQQPQQPQQQPQQQQPQPQLHEYRLDTARPAGGPTYGMQPYWANQMAPWGQPPVQPGTPSPYWQRSIPFNQQGGY